METCVSLIKAITAIKELNTVLEHVTPSMVPLLIITVQGLPYVWPFYKSLLSKESTKQAPYKARQPKAHQLKAGCFVCARQFY